MDPLIAPRREPDAEPTEPAILTYPTDGKQKEWPLTQALVDEWETLYPSLDILAECRKALAWVRANPGKRKTAGGMPRALVSWFNRANDKPANAQMHERVREMAPTHHTPAACTCGDAYRQSYQGRCITCEGKPSDEQLDKRRAEAISDDALSHQPSK